MAENDVAGSTAQIPTNLRLLILLEEVAKAGVPVTPSVVNENLGLPKPTIHRLFATAEAEGFLQRDIDGRSYSPGRRMRILATNTLSSERVRTVRLAVLKALAMSVGETCNIAIPERDGMFYLDRVETHWPLRIQLPVGTQVPFHCTASGKMYLSTLRTDYLDRFLRNYVLERQTVHTITATDDLYDELSKIRDRGYATDDQEFMAGMTAIAVPILDDRGRLLSTLSIHAPEQRRDVGELVDHLPELQRAAAELTEIVGR
ncbi:IclR family transcriptional regulator [Cognatiyoonia sp. IB215446]|uniref:IclR family transcriptional regulator n=1 Tax=Cognatiyoonia sp. IB215446 TaxID=3097355 RepID=UPI002A0EDB0F|nr:IclR family transcriptional regulator [Cognatiyoonia sp. IB215446]MDX8347202.1 IclR family transcriptional regulator [Cognatiyoonia sp. IB215446]